MSVENSKRSSISSFEAACSKYHYASLLVKNEQREKLPSFKKKKKTQCPKTNQQFCEIVCFEILNILFLETSFQGITLKGY